MDTIRYIASQEGHYLQKCYYCDRKLVYGSDTFHSHLLFFHGKFTEPCKTFRAKVDALASIEGFKLRGIARRMKRKFRSKRRVAKWNCWKWKVRFWFNYIENEENRSMANSNKIAQNVSSNCSVARLHASNTKE